MKLAVILVCALILVPASTWSVLFLAGFRGVASGECLYIPAEERGRAESVTQWPTNPICPKAPARRE